MVAPINFTSTKTRFSDRSVGPVKILGILLVTLGSLLFTVNPALSQASPESYFALEAGRFVYDQTDRRGGSTGQETWNLRNVGFRHGIHLNDWFTIETRFGSGNTKGNTFLGKRETANLKRYYGALAKISPLDRSLSPYGILGYTTGVIQTCRDNCSEGFWSETSYGGGMEYHLNQPYASSIFVEYIHYGEGKSGFPKEEIEGYNVGMTYTADELANLGKWMDRVVGL